MGHIKVSQIRIHLIENIEKYIRTCITKLFPYVFKKCNPSPIINGPHTRYDEFGRITWLLLRKSLPTLSKNHSPSSPLQQLIISSSLSPSLFITSYLSLSKEGSMSHSSMKQARVTWVIPTFKVHSGQSWSSHNPTSLDLENSLTWALLKVHGLGALFSYGIKLGRSRRTFPSIIMRLMSSWVRSLCP